MNQTIFDKIIEYTSSAPVDVYNLARELGIKIFEKQMNEECSGSIEKKNGKYLITINKQHSAKRRRFTIAHEIGHFVFHGDLLDEHAIVDNKMYRDDRVDGIIETQANRFAASILMPEKLMKSLVKAGANDISTLARELEVSEQAMIIRAEGLGILAPQEPAHI